MNFRLLLALTVSLTCFISADARRRQRVDSPIQPAADAPWDGKFDTFLEFEGRVMIMILIYESMNIILINLFLVSHK